MTKYAGGQWTLVYDKDSEDEFVPSLIVNNQNEIIVEKTIGSVADVEDARLIASAPDLLDVCLMVLEANASYDYEYKLKIPREMIDKIEKAVNKARGEV